MENMDKNIRILADNNFHIFGTAPCCLEIRTPGLEDMCIELDEPTKACLQEYIDNFDITEAVLLWWKDGFDAARKKGVPFDNIKEHYEDYEFYLENLQRVADLLD